MRSKVQVGNEEDGDCQLQVKTVSGLGEEDYHDKEEKGEQELKDSEVEVVFAGSKRLENRVLF